MMPAISIGLERHGGSRVTEGVVHLRQPSPDANHPIRATNSPARVTATSPRARCWGAASWVWPALPGVQRLPNWPCPAFKEPGPATSETPLLSQLARAILTEAHKQFGDDPVLAEV